ncbi:oligopeptide/dipeptide ABC transporter ATP-binding protein [uncultured Anaerotruncus sp.]|uniref:ABC transporter ATP-binding protein n=1 Tax=uncultured Anaerotruncus sp. TaxID=905011 RepID=UPI00280A6103|nr:oligopeptide/dipeptide ABC transporter ATP-binding protein [uncultured Anaerotruncus sp.]
MGTLLEVSDLKKYFKVPQGALHAVDGVSFSLDEGKTLGIVGESGCGKSTLGRVLVHLLDATDGRVLFEGQDITRLDKKALKHNRRNMQMIFQDPYSSINPRMTVSEIIAEPLDIYQVCADKAERNKKVSALMDTVGLAQRVADSYPHELDGGRRQRIGIARALALSPKFIVCDEPVSALDMSIQAQILNLLQDLQKEMNLTYMFITHDLSVVKHISNDIGVMYLGNMVESAGSKELFAHHYHPYTKALLSAIPRPKLHQKQERILLKGEITSPINPKPGCRFAPRCVYAKENCFCEQPQLQEVACGHHVACHYVREINGL